jgi:hypothetical protein
MPIAKQSGESRKPVKPGNYFGVVVGVYDIGTQESGEYGPKHQVILQFELHNKKGVCLGENGQPQLISRFDNLSFDDRSNLRHDTEAILNKTFSEEEAKSGYDVSKLLDCGCRLVIRNEPSKNAPDRIIDYIHNISPLDDDDPELTPQSSAVSYDLDPGAPFPEDVPEWIVNKVKQSSEWRAIESESRGRGRSAPGRSTRSSRRSPTTPGAGSSRNGGDDDIPF